MSVSLLKTPGTLSSVVGFRSDLFFWSPGSKTQFGHVIPRNTELTEKKHAAKTEETFLPTVNVAFRCACQTHVFE